MGTDSIKIDKQQLEMLFPFYLRFDGQLKVIDCGRSLKKVVPNSIDSKFQDVFNLMGPKKIEDLLSGIGDLQEDVIVLESLTKKDLVLKGQFLCIKEKQEYVFVGSPLLSDIKDLERHDLNSSDFAKHDMITDTIRVMKTKELVMQDIIELVESLKSQKQDLNVTTNRLTSLLQNLQSAVLLEDENRKIVYVNESFCKLFNIPVQPEDLIGSDCKDSAEQTKHLFKDPEDFVDRINNLLQQKTLVTDELVFLESGNILQRDFIPIEANDHYTGHLWKYKDVTEQKKKDLLIKQNEEKYRSVIENMQLGLVEVDLNNIIKKVNPRFCDMVGYKEHEIMGTNAQNFLFDEEADSIMDEQIEQRLQGKTSVYDLRIRRKDGSPIWITVSGAPIYDLNSNIIGSIGIHQDITDRKNKEELYKTAKVNAEESLRVKQQFVSNISHEIRTPLNVIIGMSELLMESKMEETHVGDVRIIRNSANHLLQLINDILDLSKMEAGKFQLNETRLHVKNLIKEQVSFQAINAKNKGLKLLYSIAPNIPEYLIGDDLKLNQILTNLINNAIKFTDKGLVNVEVELYSEREDKIELKFEVSDTGIGIEQKDLSKIFDSFTQASNDTTRLFGGTGLGLSIVKSLVELYKGKIWVESEPGQGSSFFFILPFKLSVPEDQKQTATNSDSTMSFKGTRVLIAEDNKLNMIVAKRTLENWGCKVDCAFNGVEAFEKADSGSYDAIFMDLQMPVMDGLDSTKKIRSTLPINTPIIALTAYSNEDVRKECLLAGMNEVVKKPFRKSELKTVLQNITEGVYQTSVNIQGENSFLENPYLQEITLHDPELLNTLIDVYIDEIPKTLNDIESALQTKDKERVKTCMHKLKPNIETFGTDDLLTPMKKYEQEKLNFDWEIIDPIINHILNAGKCSVENVKNYKLNKLNT